MTLDADVIEEVEEETATSSASSVGARRNRDNHNDPFERRLAAAERGTAEYMRDMRHRARQARRVVGKNAGQWRTKKMRTSVSIAGRAAGVTVAGGYLATRSTVKTARRAYKRSAPHVRRVAGHTARTVASYASVYGEHYARRAQRTAVRMRARARVAGRRREHYRRDPLYRASMIAHGQTETRSLRDARRAAHLLDPRSKRTTRRRGRQHRVPAAGHRRRANTAQQERRQDAATRARARAVRSNPYGRIPVPEHQQWDRAVDASRTQIPTQQSTNTQPTSAPTTPRGGAMATTTGNTTNPASLLEQGFKLTGNYEPITFIDWMQQLRGQAAAFRQASESYLQLAIYLDLKRRMDPRALSALYVIAAASGQMADTFIAAANQFWVLYADRLDNNYRGRVMDDERQFFSQ